MKCSLFLAAVASASAAGDRYVPGAYNYTCVGNCDSPVQPITSPVAVLAGGGTDVDEAMSWMAEQAGLGDLVVLRTAGSGEGYNTWWLDLTGANSVSTIVLESRVASSLPFVLDVVAEADAVFFAGGDQWSYVDFWANTPLQAAVRAVGRRAPLGGTSAGCAILGEMIYSAEYDTVYPEDALANPYDPHVTFATTFAALPQVQLITDTHFVTRDRMGRLVAFMARLKADGWSAEGEQVMGLGVDEHSALLLAADGTGKLVGGGSAYACRSAEAAAVCERDTPLTYEGLDCVRLNATTADTIDLATFETSGTPYTLSVLEGAFEGGAYGP